MIQRIDKAHCPLLHLMLFHSLPSVLQTSPKSLRDDLIVGDPEKMPVAYKIGLYLLEILCSCVMLTNVKLLIICILEFGRTLNMKLWLAHIFYNCLGNFKSHCFLFSIIIPLVNKGLQNYLTDGRVIPTIGFHVTL